MKKEYIEPEFELEKFRLISVIATMSDPNGGYDENDNEYDEFNN